MSIYDDQSAQNIITSSKLSSLLSTDKYIPALSNFYEIDIYAGDRTSINEHSSGERLQYFASFHATEVSIDGESISFERHPVTKTFYLGSGSITSSPYTRVDEISITWRESNDWFIKRYHEAWIGMFYDKDTDTFKSVPEAHINNLYRTFEIKLPYSVEGNRLIVVAENVLPISTGNMSLGWSNSPSLVNHTMSYKVERIFWKNAPTIDINTTG